MKKYMTNDIEVNDKLAKAEKLNALYLEIINRYKEYIEENEEKTVNEMPGLITPQDKAVVEAATKIKMEFQDYSYEKDFVGASLKALKIIKSIETVVLPVQFWLYPKDTLNTGIADTLDKHILLCSLLIALGNYSSKVLVNVNNNVHKIATYYEFSGKFYCLDEERNLSEFDSKEQLISYIGATNDSVLYEFNDKSYTDISL
ncbi:MAG: hypothetical protein ACP5RP_03055 [Candidatus Micrarchaeia archaeon]